MTLRFVLLVIVALEGAAFAAPSAEELFDEGQSAFTKGDYATAVAKWNESYELSKEPELLFNLGQGLRLGGQCAEALATYRRFVMIAPASEQRALADEFVRELTGTCDAPKATRLQPIEHAARSDPGRIEDDRGETDPAMTQKIVGLTIAGAGVVLIATGLYYGHRAASLGEEVTSACLSGCDWAVYGSKDAEGRRAETKQYVFAGIGIAAVVGGGVVYWLASRDHGRAPVAITPNGDGAAITWSGAW